MFGSRVFCRGGGGGAARWHCRRLFSSTGAAEKKTQKTSTAIIIRGLRVVRVLVVSYGIYQVGYRNGLTDYLEHPEEQQRGLVAAVLSMSNATEVLKPRSPEVERVSDIAKKVLEAAKEIAVDDLKLLKEEVAKMTKEDQASVKEQVDEAEVIIRRLSGNWNFFVTNSTDVNAFVTDIMPKSIFVNKGLLDRIDPTADELAMILAHELSHVILDHNKERSFAQGAIYAVQLVLFALVDPTGHASLIFDFVVGKLVDVLLATHSRSNEEEADMSGVKVMSKACFNAVEGSNIFLKLGALGESRSTSWLDTHPSSETRSFYIKEATELHKPSPNCLVLKKDYLKAKRGLRQFVNLAHKAARHYGIIGGDGRSSG